MSESDKIPTIGFYIRRLGELNIAEMNRNYHYMFRLLLVTSDDFHRADRKRCEDARAMLKKYVDTIESINGRHFNHTLQLRTQRGAYLYNNGGNEAKMKIIDVMWDGGYISKELFKIARPTAGDNVSGSKPLKGLPGTMSSRVQ